MRVDASLSGRHGRLWRPRRRQMPQGRRDGPPRWASFLAAAVALALAGAGAASLAQQLSQPPPLAGWVVAIDPGHGGIHPGTCHPASGLVEKELNLQLARQLEAALQEAGARVVLTRTGDETLSLQERADRVKASGAQLLLSLHVNSYPTADCFGAQAFYHRTSPDGQRLARLIQEEMRRVHPENFREALPGDYFLLRTAAIPAVLVEAGFLSSPTDRLLLTDPAFRDRLARAMAQGVIRFVQGEQPRPPSYTLAPAGPTPAHLSPTDRPGTGSRPALGPLIRWPWWSWRAQPSAATSLVAGYPSRPCPPVPDPSPRLAGRVVAIDAGHGGEDLGAIGPSGTREKDVTLAAAQAVAAALRQAGATPFLPRPGDAEPGFDDPRNATARDLLAVRLAAAQAAGASLFISLHADASPLPDVQGLTTYYWDAPILAGCVHQSLVRHLQRRDRGARQRDLYLLRAAPMPALLVEMGFLSNEEEERLLKSPAFQQRLAAALVAGLAAYFHQARAWER